MIKEEELTDPDSCICRAHPREMVFVLLARDADAPGTIRDWIKRRIASGKNKDGDPLMTEAEQCAQVMEFQFRTQREHFINNR